MSSANNKGRMSRRKKMEPWYYVGPIFLLLVIMFGYPLIKSVVMAFQNYKLGNANVYFNDFANFHKMFGDKDFLLLLKNSVVYVVVSVFGQFIGGLILALCMRDKFKGRGIYLSIVFLTWAFSAFVVGLVFRWSFNGEYGVVNDVLMKLGIIKKVLHGLVHLDYLWWLLFLP
ncbi:MAG: carbohydrate ABC transporter permease [Blautia obeum]